MSTIPPVLPPVPQAPVEFGPQALSLMVQIRELGRTVEGFRFAAPGRRSEIGTLATLPDEFLYRVAVTLDIHPAFGVEIGITSTEVREALSFRREFKVAADEIRLVAKGMDDTIAERMADVGERALRVYHNAKRATPNDSTETLVPHLDAMKSALNKGRPPKVKKDVPPPVPAPAPGPVPSPAPIPTPKGDAK